MSRTASVLRMAGLAILIGSGAWHWLNAADNQAKRGQRMPATAAGIEYAPNVVVIKFKNGRQFGEKLSATGVASVDAALRAQGVYQLQQVLPESRVRRDAVAAKDISSIYFAYFDGSQSPLSVAEALQRDPNIAYAEPKYRHRLAVAPNDPQFILQTFYNVVKATQAWDIVKGEQSNVVIAIVDGGTDIDHEDLAVNLWTNVDEIPNNGVDDDNNGFIDDAHGWNFANNSPDATGLSSTPNSADHGTHTAGIACAATNNSVGIAGMSWNARLMPICAASATDDNGIAFGYQGILYAANNGADVISLSWGGYASSSFEQDVINFAADLGIAIIAAAGNGNTSARHYPSAYHNVLAVANTRSDDVKSSTSNYGAWIDVAAPGSGILSTVNNNKYASFSGTSMSCPLVAAAVALVKTKNPSWSGIQASEQVRVMADNIDANNASYVGLLGRGRLNALRAVTETSPSIRLQNFSFAETDGDGVIEPGETVAVTVTLRNYLSAVASATVTLSENDNFVTVTTANAAVGALGTLQETTATTPLRFSVASNAPSGHPVDFTLTISSGSYSDTDRFSVTVLPTFGSVSVNNVATTVTNIGRLGFADPSNSLDGIGFRFKNGTSLLFEGGVIAGAGPTQISNAVRGLIAGNSQGYDKDFTIATGGDLRVMTPGALSDQESIGIFEDKAANNPMQIRVIQETFARKEAPADDFFLLRYTIENQSENPLTGFHFGIFYDWDIDGGSFATNVTTNDASRKLGYAYDSGSGPKTYVGMSLVSQGEFNYEGIFNDPNAPGFTGIGLHDGFTDTEKWQSISGGVGLNQAGPADISFVVAAGPFDIAGRATIEVGFALLAGESLADLQANAEAAQQFWNELFATKVTEKSEISLPQTFALQQNYPNPFRSEINTESKTAGAGTVIGFQLPKAEHVEVEIYDVLGRKIRTLLQDRRNAGVHAVRWDGLNELGEPAHNGIYFYRMRAGSFVQTRKLVLVR